MNVIKRLTSKSLAGRYISGLSVLFFLFFSLNNYAQANDELTKAVRKNQPEKVSQLLEKGIDINGIDRHGYTPLYYTIKKELPDLALTLLNHGANINQLCGPCKEANYLHIAVWNHSIVLSRILIENGIQINKQDIEGQTPLHYAVMYDQEEIAKMLLENGADPAIVNKEGISSTEIAERTANTSMIKLLTSPVQ